MLQEAWSEVGGAFIILMGGLVIAVIGNLVEQWWKRRKK